MTVRRTLGLIPVHQLHRFIANAISEESWISDSVIEAARSEPLQPERLMACLHGLRLADFYDLARNWKDIADKHEVPASSQPVLFQFAAAV